MPHKGGKKKEEGEKELTSFGDSGQPLFTLIYHFHNAVTSATMVRRKGKKKRRKKKGGKKKKPDVSSPHEYLVALRRSQAHQLLYQTSEDFPVVAQKIGGRKGRKREETYSPGRKKKGEKGRRSRAA